MTQLAETDIGIGLIGVGRHGRRYLDHLVSEKPGAFLAGLCRRRTSERPPSHLGSLSVHGDYRDLIADPRVEAVVVVTPPSLCHDICMASVQAGKPMLIEKPLATTGHEARAMVAAAEQAGVLLMTAQTMRFDPAILFLKEQLPKIGTVRYATFTSRIETGLGTAVSSLQAGQRGTLLETGIHLLDLVRFLSEEEVRDVRCEMDPSPLVGAETLAMVFAHTVSGVSCMLDVTRVPSGRVGRTEWIGTHGQASADWVQRRVTVQVGDDQKVDVNIPPQPTILAVLHAFVQAIRSRTPPPVTGLDGCRAVELADACYQSAEREGAVVRLASSS